MGHAILKVRTNRPIPRQIWIIKAYYILGTMKPCGKFNRPRWFFNHILLNQSISFIVANRGVAHKYAKLWVISKLRHKGINSFTKFAIDQHGWYWYLTMRLGSQVPCPKMVRIVNSFRFLIKFLVRENLGPFVLVFLLFNRKRSKRQVFLLERQISLFLINTCPRSSLNVPSIQGIL